MGILSGYFFVCFLILSLYTESRGTRPFQMTENLHRQELLSSRTISLNGIWEVAQGSGDIIPEHFSHKADVPGLISGCTPPFTEVGNASKLRDSFWYRRVFRLNTDTAKLVRLRILKAKYGTTVYINGMLAGSNMLNFSSTVLNITPFLKKSGSENEILVKVGAHIASLPDTVTTAGEVEKFRYIPGIYDDVELILSEQIVFNSIQVATGLMPGEVTVEADITNYGKSGSLKLNAVVFEAGTRRRSGSGTSEDIHLSNGEEKKVRFSFPVDNPLLWTPEHPDLYRLELTAGEESCSTRFGFRTFQLDQSSTHIAYLNQKPYYFRGTNISLFRFFEDPLCARQPWDREWVRTLFLKFKSLGMNAARISISALPEFWFEIADEEGFVLFAEFPMWYALKEGVSQADFDAERVHPQRKYGIFPEKLTGERLANEYANWMRDLWNHASVIAWDAQNETWSRATGEAIRIVRNLDLSNRPWDNGWSPPVSPSDYREAHQYFARYNTGSEGKDVFEMARKPFSLNDLVYLEKIPGTLYAPFQYAYDLPLNDYAGQPCILNEYGYLWLNRDGTPTTLTKPYYDAVLGSNASPDQRREHYAYVLAGLTEYWRSVRTCFGVLHTFGISYSVPGGATSDNFIDVNMLEFDPYFREFMEDAMNPLGICIESWFVKLIRGKSNDVPVMITNDHDTPRKGEIQLLLNKNGKTISEGKANFSVAASDQERTWIRIYIPDEEDEYEIVAEIQDENRGIRSLRKIDIDDLTKTNK